MSWIRSLAPEVVRFGVVGGVSYLVDVGLSNVLVYGVGSADGPLSRQPLVGRAIAFVVAMAFAWAGNLLWTYGERRSGSALTSAVRYVAVNVVSLLIVLLPTGVTWYLLGLRDPLSYNVATNVVGFALATAFRFWAYRTWVFPDRGAAAPVTGTAVRP